MSISDSKTSIYDKIELKVDDLEIYIPPTTHLVATVDDLTDVLDYDEATYMDEDVDGPTENTLPLINTCKWTATSTYNVYMVDTPRNPSKHQRRHGRGTGGDPSGNNTTIDNGGMVAGEADDPGKDLQASLERHATPEGIPEDLDPDDPL